MCRTPRSRARFRWTGTGTSMRPKIEAQCCPRMRVPGGTVSSAWVPSCLVALLLFILAPVTTTAQTAGADTTTSAPAGAPPRPSEPSGFFDGFGNWVQQGVANVGAGVGAMVGAVGEAGQAAKGAADAARDAATSVSKLPASGVIGGRERCVLAPNGAPDCRTAAAALCRTKGYVGGSSVDFETVEKCPPPYRTSGRDTPEGICTMEHFVTRALCQ
jgi:hypothetical protein